MQDSLISLKEAAQIMRCSYTKAQRIAKSGELPFMKLGATWIIPKSALYEALGMKFESGVDVDAKIA